MPLEELIERCVELEVHGLIVTDHHYQWPQAELDDVARKAGAGGLVILGGYEVTTVDPDTGRHAGDILVFGAPESVAPLEIWTPYDEACRRGHEIGALLISAHPFREGMGAGDRVYHMDIDGIEIFNQNHSQLHVAQAKQAVLRCGFLGVAGSDAHSAVQVGQFYTVLDRPARTMSEFTDELRARRYAIQSNRPDIR